MSRDISNRIHQRLFNWTAIGYVAACLIAPRIVKANGIKLDQDGVMMLVVVLLGAAVLTFKLGTNYSLKRSGVDG